MTSLLWGAVVLWAYSSAIYWRQGSGDRIPEEAIIIIRRKKKKKKKIVLNVFTVKMIVINFVELGGGVEDALV